MREMIKLIVTVFVFSAFSGAILAVLHHSMNDRIEYQELVFVRGPALRKVMEGSTNDPLLDRFKLKDGKKERDFYVGVFDGKPNVIALESVGKGYDGDIGVMVAVNLEDDKIVGIGITTHSETPGVGARTKTDPAFNAQFKGLPIKEPFSIRDDGGNIDALSGASFSSRGVCGALLSSAGIYLRLKEEIVKKAQGFTS